MQSFVAPGTWRILLDVVVFPFRFFSLLWQERHRDFKREILEHQERRRETDRLQWTPEELAYYKDRQRLCSSTASALTPIDSLPREFLGKSWGRLTDRELENLGPVNNNNF